jgi:hypothetical protein
MPQTIAQALQQASFYTDGDMYYVVHLHPRAITVTAAIIAELSEPFLVMIVDKDEVTLVIEQESFEEYQGRLLGFELSKVLYRLITFDVALEPTLTGFMAHISKALAQAGVPIFPYAAYNRDHLLVPAPLFETAMNTLQQLKQDAQG